MTRHGITPDEEYAIEIQRQGPSDLAACTEALRRFRLGIEDRTRRLGRIIGDDRAAIAEIERRYPREREREDTP